MLHLTNDRTLWQNLAYMLSMVIPDAGARVKSEEYFEKLYNDRKMIYVMTKRNECNSCEEEFEKKYKDNLAYIEKMPKHITFMVSDLRVLALGIVCPEVKSIFNIIYKHCF